MRVPARDGEDMRTVVHDQTWLVSWHPPSAPPVGRPHGAAGICVTAAGGLVLISHDGEHWGFPAGRPEGTESWLETLRREVHEEACAVVADAQLLGFSRNECVQGHEMGLVLVRSYWRAQVEVLPWEPGFEISHRRIITLSDAADVVRDPGDVATRIAMRALAEAGLL